MPFYFHNVVENYKDVPIHSLQHDKHKLYSDNKESLEKDLDLVISTEKKKAVVAEELDPKIVEFEKDLLIQKTQ